jgi:hypothetical protein
MGWCLITSRFIQISIDWGEACSYIVHWRTLSPHASVLFSCCRLCTFWKADCTPSLSCFNISHVIMTRLCTAESVYMPKTTLSAQWNGFAERALRVESEWRISLSHLQPAAANACVALDPGIDLGRYRFN